MSNETILIVDDEEDIIEFIKYNLEKEHYDVITAENGEKGLEKIKKYSPDLVVLDIMMPGIDGLEVCRRTRATPENASLPIIMLTAKTDETDIVVGLELGADDYISKPFSPKVLLARIKSVLRRKKSNSLNSNGIINYCNFKINTEGRNVSYKGHIIDLTFSEYEILKLLISHPGRVFSRRQIMKAARDEEYISTERAIDVQILNIRKKLGDGAENIKTVRGAGYKFNG